MYQFDKKVIDDFFEGDVVIFFKPEEQEIKVEFLSFIIENYQHKCDIKPDSIRAWHNANKFVYRKGFKCGANPRKPCRATLTGNDLLLPQLYIPLEIK